MRRAKRHPPNPNARQKPLAQIEKTCSSSVLNNPKPGRPTLNAISPEPPPADERTQRHLSMCEELAELGMGLVRAVAHKAMQDWTEDEARAKPPAKRPDPAQTFVRLSGAVRQAIALEARIAKGPTTQARRGREKKFDPRRATLKRLVHETTERNPDRNDLRKGAQQTIEDHLADDLYDETAMPDLFQSICREAGIEPSQRALSDEMLDIAFPGPWPDPPPPKPRPTFLVDIPPKGHEGPWNPGV